MIRLDDYPVFRVTRSDLRISTDGAWVYRGPSLARHGGSLAVDANLGTVMFDDSVRVKGSISVDKGSTLVIHGDFTANGDIQAVQSVSAEGDIKAFRNIESAYGSITAQGCLQSVSGHLLAAGDLRSRHAMRASRIQSYQGSVVSQIEGMTALQSSIVAGGNIWSGKSVTAVDEIRSARSITAKQSIRGGDIRAATHIMAGWDIAAHAITAGVTLGAGYADAGDGADGLRRDGIVGEILQGRITRGVSLSHNPPIPSSEVMAHYASRRDALVHIGGQFPRHHDERNNTRLRRAAVTRFT